MSKNMMIVKEQRFLPITRKEPIEEYYDEFGEEDIEEIFDFGSKKGLNKKKSHQLYLAS